MDKKSNPLFFKSLIFLVLTSLTISAFIIRLNTHKNTEYFTVDEMVYWSIGSELNQDALNYHSRRYAAFLMSQGKDVPEYFIRPLFKHPPLFSYSVAMSIWFFWG